MLQIKIIAVTELEKKGKLDLHSRNKVEVRDSTRYQAIPHAAGIGSQQIKPGVQAGREQRSRL